MIFEGVHSRLFLNDIGASRSHMCVGVECETCFHYFLIVRLFYSLLLTIHSFELDEWSVTFRVVLTVLVI